MSLTKSVGADGSDLEWQTGVCVFILVGKGESSMAYELRIIMVIITIIVTIIII